jgi:hypothetical protein
MASWFAPQLKYGVNSNAAFALLGPAICLKRPNRKIAAPLLSIPEARHVQRKLGHPL